MLAERSSISESVRDVPEGASSTPPVGGRRDQSASFRTTLEALDQEIIPRLIARLERKEPNNRYLGTDAEIDWFTATLLRGDDEDAATRVRQLLAGVWTMEQIFLDLISGIARRLGQFWHEDRASFYEVTIAMGRLRELMESLEPEFHGSSEPTGLRRGRILIAPARGEQHTLGARMVAAFMSRAGWDVTYLDDDAGDRFDTSLDEPLDLIGFSIGSKARLPALREDIAAIRAHFSNPSHVPAILVGGPLILAHPELAQECGADGFAMDAAQALIAAHGYLPCLKAG